MPRSNLTALGGPGDPAGEVGDYPGRVPSAELQIGLGQCPSPSGGGCRHPDPPAPPPAGKARCVPTVRTGVAPPPAADSAVLSVKHSALNPSHSRTFAKDGLWGRDLRSGATSAPPPLHSFLPFVVLLSPMEAGCSSQAPRCAPASHSVLGSTLAARTSQRRWTLLGKSSRSAHPSPRPFLTSGLEGSGTRCHCGPHTHLPAPPPLLSSLTPCTCSFSFSSAAPQPVNQQARRSLGRDRTGPHQPRVSTLLGHAHEFF